MKVIWKYDLLFSFNITYTGGLDPGDFSVVPLNSSKNLLGKKHLVYKSAGNGGLIIAEKRINPDSTTEAVGKFSSLHTFTFIIKLNNQSLFPGLLPYSSDPNAVLPGFYGRRRILYFDNLNDELVPDQGLTPVSQTTDPNLSLSSLDIAASSSVSSQDLASIVPNEFFYRRETGVNKITLSPIHPDAAVQEFVLSNEKPTINVDLSTNAYRFEQTGSFNSSEIVFAGSELLSKPVFGVIQIFKSADTDFDQAIRYDINFEES